MLEDALLRSVLKYFRQQSGGKIPEINHPGRDVVSTGKYQRNNLREAAVLIPLIPSRGILPSQVVMTLRSSNLSNHAGQVSLPGGRRDPGDQSVIDTALRESAEEIGIDPQQVTVLGRLGEILLPSGFRVTPVIGMLTAEQSFTPCSIEVEEIFMAPLKLILDPASYSESIINFAGKPRKTIEINHAQYKIWGATAVILHHLAKEIRDFQTSSNL
jgi:8-oxo-dGTP pyrophosphatase MutT (NUDIX family)